MHTVSFYDLYSLDFELSDLFGMRQKWSDGSIFDMNRPRRSNGILYLNGCSGSYSCSHSALLAPRGSLVCLPAGSQYAVLNYHCGKATPDALLVEFNLYAGNEMLTLGKDPFLIPESNTYLVTSLMTDVIRAYEASAPSPIALRAAVCRLLSFMAESAFRKKNEVYRSIATGIELMENDPTDQLSIAEIAELCNVSSGYFRKQFKEYSGKSPIRFRLDRKIETAKKMLETSAIRTEELADFLGMESGAYFCRLFKEKTGMTPGEYRKKHI